MKHCVRNIISSKDENKKSYQIEVIKMADKIEIDRFRIPVIDVRDGQSERGYVNTSIKLSKKPSKYMASSFSVIGKSYQVSQKRNIGKL